MRIWRSSTRSSRPSRWILTIARITITCFIPIKSTTDPRTTMSITIAHLITTVIDTTQLRTMMIACTDMSTVTTCMRTGGSRPSMTTTITMSHMISTITCRLVTRTSTITIQLITDTVVTKEASTTMTMTTMAMTLKRLRPRSGFHVSRRPPTRSTSMSREISMATVGEGITGTTVVTGAREEARMMRM